MGRVWGVGLILVAVLGGVGCTSDGSEPVPGPTPSPTSSPGATAPPITGPRVAVVLPTADEDVADPGSLEIDRIRSTFADRVSSVRAVTPDTPDFTSDVLGLLAEQGNELVCVIGPRALETVVEIASDYPRTRFCVFPAAAAEVPANVLLLDLAVEEVAVLAATVASGVAPKDPPAFIGSRQEYAIDRRRFAFQAVAREAASGRGDAAKPLIGVPADDAERAASFASTQFEAGASVVYTEAGSADRAVLAVAEEAGGMVIGSSRTLGVTETGTETEPSSRAVLLTIEERFDAALEIAIERLLGEWSTDPVTVGFADGAFQLGAGRHRRAPRAMAIAERVRAAMEAGELDLPQRP